MNDNKSTSAVQFGFWHRVSIASTLLLIMLIVIWNIRVPTPTPMISIGIGISPLVFGFWHLLRAIRLGFVYYALWMLLYFSHAIVSLMSSPSEWLWSSTELLLSLSVFFASLQAAKIIGKQTYVPNTKS